MNSNIAYENMKKKSTNHKRNAKSKSTIRYFLTPNGISFIKTSV